MGAGPGERRSGEQARAPAVRCSTIDDVIQAYRGLARSIAAYAGMREDVDDVVQDAFVDMAVYLRKHPMPDDVEAMVVKITWARIWDRVRSRSREKRRRGRLEAQGVPPSNPTPEETVRLRQLALAVFDEMSPEEEMMMRQYGGATAEEIDRMAERMRVTPATLRSKVSRAREKFAAVAARLAQGDPGDEGDER
jgi:RNA polymerase sigma factor (sigma-70 family)